MTSSLVPERPLLISPTLAATIGLEEAVLLHIIAELLLRSPAIPRDQRRWGRISRQDLAAAAPFWTAAEVEQVRHNLQAQGLLLAEDRGAGELLLAINQRSEDEAGTSHPTPVQRPAQPAPSPFASPQSGGRASLIPPDWQPCEDLYRQCQQHNIPRDFVAQRVKGFVMYWRERQKPQYAWQHTFLKYILKEWRQAQSAQGAREQESEMHPDWRPSEDAISILEHAGVNPHFIEDSIPEFVLYWRERGLVTSTWSSKFLSHVRRQWAKYSQTLENDTTPRPINPDYEPSDACYEVLAMANIDLDFARAQIPEFVLYWLDNKQSSASWNTRFLQHVKYKWARKHEASLPVAQQVESALERFTDRSWAD